MLRALSIWRPAIHVPGSNVWERDQRSIMARTAALFLSVGAACSYLMPTSLRNKILIPYDPSMLVRFAGDGSLPAQAMTAAIQLASLPLKFSMPLAAATLSGWLAYQMEGHRATRALDAIAAQSFTRNIRNANAIDYLKAHLSAIKRLGVGADYVALLNSLVQDKNLFKLAPAFKLTVDRLAQAQVKIPEDLFLHLIEADNASLISYVFSKQVVPEWGEDLAVDCWSLVQSPGVAESLITGGWGVNIRGRASDKTPLEANIAHQCEKGQLRNFYILLGAGATITDEKLEELLATDPGRGRKAAWLEEKAVIRRAIEQAPGMLSQIEELDAPWYAFWKHAVTVSPRHLRIKGEDIVLRAAALAIPLVGSLQDRTGAQVD